jgi:hypothetical protein
MEQVTKNAPERKKHMATVIKDDNEQYIYCKYIVKNGKRIYPKNASVFKIPLSSLNKRKLN